MTGYPPPPMPAPTPSQAPIPERVIPAGEMPPWSRVAIYKLQLLGAEVLKQRAVTFDPARDQAYLAPLVAAMTGVVERFKGWGLSAPQVGASVRVAIARLDGRLDGPLVTLINPIIRTRSFAMRLMVEGCLSIPSFETKVLRHQSVTFSYLDDRFEPQTASVFGYPAQVIQHEVEHLDGRMLTDRVSAKHRAIAETSVAKARARYDL